MKDRKKRGIGLSFALAGLKTAFISERNFRIHIYMMFIVTGLGYFLHITKWEWMILILVISAVIFAELVNSVVERMIDYIKPEIHPEAKMIKDMAAGAVLVTAIASVLIGCIIFLPKIF